MAQRSTLVERGAEASVIEGLLGAFLQDQLDLKLHHLLSLYRSREYEFNQMLGLVAEISALDELRDVLTQAQRRGHTALEQEVRNGSQVS